MSDLALQGPPPPARRAGRFDGLALLLFCLAVWQSVALWTHGIAVSPPVTAIVYLVGMMGQASFWSHAGATLAAFLLAFVLSAVLGLLLGLALGVWRFAGEVWEPILAGFYTIPKVTLYPVVLLVAGLGMSAKVAFGVMHGMVPITLLTLASIRNLSPTLLRTARVLRLPPRHTIAWVLVPACLPDIIAGLRIGFSLSLLGVLIGEMFSSQRGLGFLLVSGMAQHNVPLTTAIVLLIVVVAISANTAMLKYIKVK
jgi:NitT/TauT family transport system permease protein